MKKRIFFAVLIIGLVVVLIGFRMYLKQTPDVVQKKPDVATTAHELIAAFGADSAAASKRFMDKVVQVTGQVKAIDTSGAIVLGVPDGLSEVVLSLDRRHKEDHTLLKVGQAAVLQGVCSGYAGKSSVPDDLLSALGTTIQFRSAGVKK